MGNGTLNGYLVERFGDRRITVQKGAVYRVAMGRWKLWFAESDGAVLCEVRPYVTPPPIEKDTVEACVEAAFDAIEAEIMRELDGLAKIRGAEESDQ